MEEKWLAQWKHITDIDNKYTEPDHIMDQASECFAIGLLEESKTSDRPMDAGEAEDKIRGIYLLYILHNRNLTH